MDVHKIIFIGKQQKGSVSPEVWPGDLERKTSRTSEQNSDAVLCSKYGRKGKKRYLRKMPHAFKNKLGAFHNQHLLWSRPTLSFLREKKKKADEWEENRKKKGERWYVTDLVTSPPIAFSFSKVSYLFWNPNFHQFDGMKLLISH